MQADAILRSWIFCFNEHQEVPEDLTDKTDAELVALNESLTARFEELYHTEGGVPQSALPELEAITEATERVRSEQSRRETDAAEAQAKADEMAAKVLPKAQEEGETPTEEPAPEEEPAAEPEEESAAEPEAEQAKELVTAAAKIPATPIKHAKLNVPLSEVRARASKVEEPPRRAVVTAAADVPGFDMHSQISDIDGLGRAMHARAKRLPTTSVGSEHANYVHVAEFKNEFPNTIDGSRFEDGSGGDTTLEEIERVLSEIRNPKALVAAGGWCAPSETRYDFFELECEDGMIDLPTVGINRGGIRFPVSPTLADVFTGTFNNTTNPWLWTETDDILTVTGGVNKPCVRVPCPSFTDVRLECYGICLTAGNLADAAYPEATRRQIALLRSALFHASNQRYIAQIVTSAGVAVTGGGFGTGGNGVVAPTLGGVELAAIDIRTRFGMCDDDILEVVVPFWLKGAFRADLAKRNGVDLIDVSDARLADFFDVRKVRVQYVSDWQVRSGANPGQETPITNWPTAVNFLIYPAGTYVLGNGPVIDLGVVRDSVLNAENDHTAIWMEECHLIARFGPAARLYTVAICTDGTTGANDLTACGL